MPTTSCTRTSASGAAPRAWRASARRLALVAVLSLLAVPAASAQATFCEQGGLIVAQIESAPAVGGWVVETAIPGYTGTSYYRWAGPDLFTSPGQGILTYTLNVSTPGTYQMRIRNLHDNPDATIENDCWTRMDGGGWTKTFSPFADPAWNWATWFDPGFDFASYVLSAGTHTFQISGRSTDFRIDRVHFFLDGTPSPQGLFHPESFCPQTWTNLGQGKPGTGGITPSLAGTGTLVAGSPVVLSLAQARADSFASLVIGFAQVNLPFKGGVLVPAANLVINGLPTTSLGTLTIPSTWPAGIPAHTGVWFQYWVVDPAASFNLSASNGLKATTP